MCLFIAVPLKRDAFKQKHPVWVVFFGKKIGNVFSGIALHKTTGKHSYGEIFAVLVLF